ncbi:hypothetical protein D3C80_1280750 [compost metagenome]|uniref:hypothetical protein n=1 Tax=Aeromonas caviae TaxID=648 RepID=UPI000F9419F8|nr:hypothetical protein [Aeromonas caviae]
MEVEQVGEEVESSYRKNLMIVAAIISIYSIAGGGFNSELEISGAKLTFTKPEYLEYTSIVVLIFLWWRHWLVSFELRDAFKHQVKSEMGSPPNCIVKLMAVRVHGNEATAFKTKLNQLYSFAPDVTKAVFYNINLLGFSYKMNVDGKVEFYSYNIKGNFIEFLVVNAIYRKAWVKSVLFKTHFGDAILPSIITLVAITTYTINFITR